MRFSITVEGVVQGIGFRPFIAQVAQELGIGGTVCNSGGIVKIMAEGTQEAVGQMVSRLRLSPPKGAVITKVEVEAAEDAKTEPEDINHSAGISYGPMAFRIVESQEEAANSPPLFIPDLPICETCLQELDDPRNRRYQYPLISCTSCGPRYSILNYLPYDRISITMKAFPMCPACQCEYIGQDRRRHAQTISCHDCGPQLALWEQESRNGGWSERKGERECGREKNRKSNGKSVRENPIMERTAQILQSGGIVALKGIGGFQFACLPTDAAAVAKLRQQKQRNKKPFAVMFPGMEEIRACCEVSEAEEQLLCSASRPIVLLKKRRHCFVTGICFGSPILGAFLPNTGMHQMLTNSCGPLVMTSGNVSAESIVLDESDLFAAPFRDLNAVLTHTRSIATPLDDSVQRVFRERPLMIRRSRGYVPAPLQLPVSADRSILAVGGDLKAVFCLAAGDRAYLSQYFGDLQNYSVWRNYQENIRHMEAVFGIHPTMIACDLHPGYRSADSARKLSAKWDIPLLLVQHHEAHVASVMAEHGLCSCIGVAFDGTGYGRDGTIWGGEFFSCQNGKFERRGYLAPIPLVGADASARNAQVTAECYRMASGCEPGDFPIAAFVKAAQNQGIQVCRSSSMGRLFDAVSAILSVCRENGYEGECAIALEQAAALAMPDRNRDKCTIPLAFAVEEAEGMLVADPKPLIRDLINGKEQTGLVKELALAFHEAAACMVRDLCIRIREQTQETCVALSGGVFANQILLERCATLLEQAGFLVYYNEAVPCNDGGIAYGQAWIAAREEVVCV